MSLVANVLVAIVAFMHVLFLVLEMFFWNRDLGRKVFRLTPEFARESAALAKNQGLYNGFLAAGLLYSLVVNHPQTALTMQIFFLSCVIVAGVFGAWTVSRSIFFVQALPAILALASLIV